MPVIAPVLRTFAPELWGEVDKFRHFYATTYTFDERAKRAVSGVEAHFIKYQRLTALAEKLRPNLRIDEAQLDERGFTPADNAGELATVIEAAILELYSSIDCTVKVLRAIYGATTRGFKDSTRGLFQSADKLTGAFPDALKPLFVNASWYRELRLLRDELTHLATGVVRRNAADGPVSYTHFGLKPGGKPLEIADVFGWLETMAGHVNAFLGIVFQHLNGTLKDTPVMEPCGMVEGRILMRQLSPAGRITFDSGTCMSRIWFDLPENPTCPFKDHCGAYRGSPSPDTPG
jgi:hypothetical protein